MKMHQLSLESPLFTDWSEQYCKLCLPEVTVGAPLRLTINGVPAMFQYTGVCTNKNAEIMVKLGFAKGEQKTLTFAAADDAVDVSGTDLTPAPIPLADGAMIGNPDLPLCIPAPIAQDGGLAGPFGGFGDHAFRSVMLCPFAFQDATLVRTNAGPFFSDYELTYTFAQNHTYQVRFRCYRTDPFVEVAERYALGLDSRLVWQLNPQKRLNSILSREWFENEIQPTVEPIAKERPQDVLCRLQMPVLSEYFIPKNRGWFAFFHDKQTELGMLGVLGLYGARWKQPAKGMPVVHAKDGIAQWHASLESGERHFLLSQTAVETQFTHERRLLFHRLHAEFNALRLDAHLDLCGTSRYDRFDAALTVTSIVGYGDVRSDARIRMEGLAPLRKIRNALNLHLENPHGQHAVSLRALLEPTEANNRAVYELISKRFEKWVRQFQGWRTGENDYAKNVIGFSRMLRGLLLGYEVLVYNNALDEAEIARLNTYFVFAARRILDEGRWPHSRTALHPDHPESIRPLYSYAGEHAPDRLYWTNSLPNFQSDPLCALAHLACVCKHHPDADAWLSFALDDIEKQLDAYCGNSGAWVESLNYALYTLSYFVITFRALRAHRGIDYFHDARVRRMVEWLVRMLGPKDKRWDAHTYPGVGNVCCPTGGGEYLLCFAGELEEDDPLRAKLIAVYQRLEANCKCTEHYPLMMALNAPIPPDEWLPLPTLHSECMDEVGVALRHRHDQVDESYLFQKIGFAKDHYEADETAFNWYAKGTPFMMDYGTYTADVAIGSRHNNVEIPDADPLRRGYLRGYHFTPRVDFTHAEVPITLKLLHGRMRSFAEIDAADAQTHRDETPYFYVGDDNPIGPKVWKTRLLFYVKPDYLVLFDRVYGDVPHRLCLHFTGENLVRDSASLSGDGRFDLDFLAHVQHPQQFQCETGEVIPNLSTPDDPHAGFAHRQQCFYLYNETDSIYRTCLFAKERSRDVQICSTGKSGLCVTTAEYTDYVFLGNDMCQEEADGIAFRGRSAWVRRTVDGNIQAIMVDGESLSAFGKTFRGRGPWSYNMRGQESTELLGGPPRSIQVI